ncbi:hypothetical protein MJL33_24780 [Salmonella enterica subsp. enterica serovar Kentucky]|nr:hypothetical protein [Salmonella enterica subsp. enterica serovar Kentucky]
MRRRGLKDNIKLGAGGIREIEFIVQVFQLIRGGREPSLQSPSSPGHLWLSRGVYPPLRELATQPA